MSGCFDDVNKGGDKYPGRPCNEVLNTVVTAAGTIKATTSKEDRDQLNFSRLIVKFSTL